jgi:sec-independent protein translocase protein TatA
MLGMLSDTGVLVLVVAVVLLFGTSQIPKLARNLAEAGKEFRRAHAEAENSENSLPSASPALSPAEPVPAAPVAVEDRITLTRSELEALVSGRNGQPVDQA